MTTENVVTDVVANEFENKDLKAEKVVNPVARVKILMLENGVTQVGLVKKFGLDKADISKVINFKRKTARIREVIAQELGLDVDEVFVD